MRRTFNLAFLIGLAVTVVAPAAAQGGITWRQLFTHNNPPAGSGRGMVYDEARQQIVLFDGVDTWAWNGNDWVRQNPSNSPSQRNTSFAMACDTARQRVVLFGGSSFGFYLDDTWEWDGTNWTLSSPPRRPPARFAHYMAYDAARQRVVLFGGWTPGPTYLVPANDTWEWDGANWTEMTPAIRPAPGGGAMAYDPIRQRVLLSNSDGTWEWDGRNWIRRSTGFGLTSATLAFEGRRSRMVLFGGWDANAFPATASGLTSEWNGSAWTVHGAGLGGMPTRFSHGMAFDSAREQLVVFGGGSSTSPLSRADTWVLESLAPASFTPYGTGCPGSSGIPALDAVPYSLPWINDRFTVEVRDLPPGAHAFMVLGFTRTTAPVPLLPGCTRLIAPSNVDPLVLNGAVGTWSTAVPDNPVLVGWSLFFQAAALNAGGNNALGGVLSNAGEARVGRR